MHLFRLYLVSHQLQKTMLLCIFAVEIGQDQLVKICTFHTFRSIIIDFPIPLEIDVLTGKHNIPPAVEYLLLNTLYILCFDEFEKIIVIVTIRSEHIRNFIFHLWSYDGNLSCSNISTVVGIISS